MRLIVESVDGTEELIDVAPGTVLRRCLKDDYWWFRSTSGGQLAIAASEVVRVEVGNVQPPT